MTINTLYNKEMAYFETDTFFCAYLLSLSNIGQTIPLEWLLLSNGRDAQSTSERRMAEEEVEKIIHHTKRIFINNVDSYASTCIAKFLSACVVGASLVETDEPEVEEGEERLSKDDHPKVKDGTFQIVGTIANKNERRPSYVLDEYFQLKREELLERLMECDIIIYNITEDADQMDEASWAISALHAEMARFSQPKMFILISTVMTWALSKPVDADDPEIPFTEEDYRRRRAHPNFKEHINVEKHVVKMGKTKSSLLSTYVVASGVQYGMGEQVFHFFFKTSWLGDLPKVPIFGEGTNVIPTIHINDLAGVIQNVIDHKPKPHYLVAVDDSKTTIDDIVKTIADVVGPGKTKRVPKEDAFLTRDLRQMDIDALFVNLRIEAVYLKESFNIHWVCESGLIDNIDRVVEEYKQTRGLLPIRVCIMGPPAVGKSTVAERICKHYKLHHIRLKETITETLAHLESIVRMEDGETEAEDSATSSELLETLKENMDQNGGRLDDQYVIRIMRDKLKSKLCRNQGFVLDSFPKTYEQAKDLFYADDDEPEDMRSKIPPFNKKIIPEFVFSLDSSDAFLKNRVLNLPESLVEGTSYSQEQFLRRLARFRESNVEDETVLNYFEELDIHPEHIEITSSDDQEYLVVTERIIKSVGKPKNYGPTSQELEEEERRSADRRLRTEAQKRADTERRETEEAQQRAARWEEWSKCLEEVKKQEHDLLEVQAVPLRNYLMKNVMPTLTQGLIECCKTRPQDPVDFLAEYLFKSNPQVE
ncbi:adenylate kinase 7 [Oncorhynchus kisutch]|uniref:Adenylate kinase 7b n=1 Tax=Oncorhynchus kisutch TaxID=8019 RepID=A0A8C7H8W5_ONCKI|nr:adenylate kinase 7 [Oncorhynchus kisutch]